MFIHLPKDMKCGKMFSFSAALTRLRWLLNVELASDIRYLSGCCYLCALVGWTSVFGNREHLCENQTRKKERKSGSKPTWRGSLRCTLQTKQELNVWGSSVPQDVGSINKQEEPVYEKQWASFSPKRCIPHWSNHIPAGEVTESHRGCGECSVNQRPPQFCA